MRDIMNAMATSLVLFALAGFANVVIGMIWYHPKVFGGAWMRMSGIAPVEGYPTWKMMVSAFFALLAGMLIAWVMSLVGYALNEFVDWISALELGFWCWLGFIAPTLLGTVLWERKPFTLYLINTSYWLVSFIAIALVLVIGTMYLGAAPLSY